MIYDIISILDNKITIIDEPQGYVEHISDADGNKRPAKYKAGGDYEDINFFSEGLSRSYWRVLDRTSVRNEESNSSCATYNERTYRLSYVMVSGREDCVHEDELFDKLSIELDGVHSEIKKALGLKRAMFEFISYTTDREKISKDEYNNDMNYRLEYIALAVEIEIRVVYDVKCLKDICYAVS